MLRVFRSNRVEPLADGLARRLAADPPADPFEPVQVAVPSHGIERWLTQRLAGTLGSSDGEAGVCANIAFPFPGRVLADALRAALDETDADADPWAPERLAWPLLELLARLPEGETFAPLRAHLATDADSATRRRFPLARRIADLFDRYALYRPEMMLRWAEGAAVGPGGEPLRDELAWQPALWREARTRLGAPSPAERRTAALLALRDRDPDGLRARLATVLPSSVELFGVVTLPPAQLDVLAALGRHIDVTLDVVAPCRSWALGQAPRAARHPLLGSCGQASRDLHASLARHLHPSPGAAEEADTFVDPLQTAEPGEPSPPSMLHLLQADVLADRDLARDGDTRPVVGRGDRSLQAHACHGPTRQLEVLRQVLYDLLERHRDLEPRDIVVLTPDIAAHEPLISAVFGDGDPPGRRAGQGRPAWSAPDGEAARAGVPALPFRVADRTLRAENPIADALATVLDLVGSRVTASAVLDLLASEPVRRRFGLSAADPRRVSAWVHGTGISWGIDGDHRRDLIGLPEGAHTWRFGIDRLALGAAMADDGHRMLGGVVPYDHVEGADVDLVGRLAAATDSLFARLRDLRAPRPVAEWRTALEATVDELLAGDPEGSWQVEQVRDAIARVVDDSADPDGAPSAVPLALEELRVVLGARLGAAPGPTPYGSGAITFCGLVPLRNVPHRVVCLVGMDDGALPRTSPRPGFDLLATGQPQPGDPDPRVEDRQLLLDAVLAARQHLVITFTGRDPRTNEPRQPAVPVAELLDALDASVAVEGAASATAHVLVEHPLQAHSPRDFGAEGPPRSFDRRQLAAAEALCAPSVEPAPFFPAPLAPPGPGELDPVVIELSDLLRFLEHPVRFLLTRRVGLALGDELVRLTDRDPVELDGLQRWRVGSDLLERRLGDRPVEQWRTVTLACGSVPVGGLGEVALDEVDRLVDELCRRAEQTAGHGRAVPVDVPIELPGGRQRRLVGSVDLVGSTVLHVGVSRLSAKHRLTAWTRALAATAAEAGADVTARMLGRDGREGIDEVAFRAPADTATQLLGQLVALYERGHVEPVPLFPETSRRYALERHKGKEHLDAVRAAERAWADDFSPRGDGFDAYHVQAFGGGRDLESIDQATDFAPVARLVWGPSIAAEEQR